MLNIRRKTKNIPQGVKASVAMFLATLITKGIAYITTPLYTRLLSPEEYAQVSVFLTWLQVLGVIAMFAFADGGVFNNGMSDYPDKRDEYSFSILILSNLITVCFLGVLFSVYPFIRQWIGLSWPLVLLMGAIFLLEPAYLFWVIRQRYELKYKMTTKWSVTTALLSLAVAVICILIFKDHRLYARIFGAKLTLIAIYLGFYIYLGMKSKWKVETKYWKAAFLFNLPLIPHFLSTYMLSSSDKLMISILIGDSATAYYSVAYAVSTVGMIVWTATNASLLPYTYEKCKKKDYSAVSAVAMPIVTVFAAVCVLVIMLAPEAVAVMATADYKEAIYAIPPIVGGVFFLVHYYMYGNVIYFYKKPKYILFASLTAAVLNLILNYIFIPQYGYIAAGYTTLFCYLVQAAIDFYGMKRAAGGVAIYNMRYIGLLSLGVIAVSLLSNFVYDYAIIRYAVILLLLALGVIFRKKIVTMIRTIRQGKKRED